MQVTYCDLCKYEIDKPINIDMDLEFRAIVVRFLEHEMDVKDYCSDCFFETVKLFENIAEKYRLKKREEKK